MIDQAENANTAAPIPSRSRRTLSHDSAPVKEMKKLRRIRRNSIKKSRNLRSNPSVFAQAAREALEEEEDFCLFCGDVGNKRCLTICISCGVGAHTYCLGPMNYQVPRGQWQCDLCKTAGEGPRVVGWTKRVLTIDPEG